MDKAKLRIQIQSTEVGTATSRLRELHQTGTQTQRATDGVGNSAAGMGKRMLVAGAAIAGVTLGVQGLRMALRAVVRINAEFEESMAGVRAVTRATDESMARMTQTARELGATTRFSASEAASGMRFLGMAGFEANEIVEAMPGLLNLATAGMLGLGEAADIASNIMSGFNISASESGRVADVLAAASSSANTSVQQLGEGLKFVAPIASAVGISLEETAAAMSVLSDAGIQGGMAGTSLRSVLSNLLNTTPQVERVIRSYGLTMEDVNVETRSLSDVIETLGEAGLSAGDALTIFGDRGAPAILAMVSQIGRLKELNEEYENSAGRAQEMASVMDDTLRGALRRLGSAAQELALTFGDRGGLTHNLMRATDAAADFIRILSQDPESSPVVDMLRAWDAAWDSLSDNMSPEDIAATHREIDRLGEALDQAFATTSPREFVREAGLVQKQMDEIQKQIAHQIKLREMAESLSILPSIFSNPAAEGVAQANIDRLTLEMEALQAIRNEMHTAASDAQRKALEEQERAESDAAALRRENEEREAELAAAMQQRSRDAVIADIERSLMTEEQLLADSHRKRLELIWDNTNAESEIRQELIERVEAQYAEELRLVEEKEQAKEMRLADAAERLAQREEAEAERATQRVQDKLDRMDRANIDEKERLLNSYQEQQTILEMALAARLIAEEEFTVRSAANWDSYRAQLEQITTDQAARVQASQMHMYSEVLGMAGKVSSQLHDLAEEGSSSAKALFIVNKAISIAQAILYTELAAARALAEGGTLFAISFSSAIRALGYASVGIMAGTAVMEVGAYDHGGQISSGSFGIVGENGPELVRGPATVTSTRTTADMGSSRSEQKVTVIVNTYGGGDEVTREDREGSDGKIIEISVQKAQERVAQDLYSGNGPVSRTLESRYNMRRGA